MEVFRTDSFYIFKKGENSLWCDRSTGCFIPKTAWSLTEADDPVCLGTCDGIIGKVSASVFDPRLMVIRESSLVGTLHGEHNVYKVKSIAFIPLCLEETEINLKPCHKHKNISNANKQNNSIFDIQKSGAFSKTWGTIKNAGNSIKNTTQQAAAIATGTPKKRDGRDRNRFERQIIEEFHKIFTDTNSFYYSNTTDLTNSLQRLCNLEKTGKIKGIPLWRIADDKFFWNKFMVKDFIEPNSSLYDPWILPIIQGYIQIEKCRVNTELYYQSNIPCDKSYEIFTLSIISRRSRFRAGTRYKRRGVDEQGHVANYVETEQLISYHSHEVSFVQVRGSVPVYWSQPGYKYRPPPRIDKGEKENQEAFEKHFCNEIKTYGPICAINLVDQSGHEKVIFDAYSNQIFQFDSPFITYVTFDFHEYCRGMHFENVSVLMNAIADILKEMNYCWRDQHGHICSQNGVFRVNCIDCLDRTNVVQTAIGKAVMEIQFCKLGLTPPEGPIPENIRSTFQLLWANNGDTISKQYAGTNALKGDYTRTGERKISGIMKDGMNSANRYYLSRFKDSTRQGTIDLMLGNKVSEENFIVSKASQPEDDHMATAEHIKLLFEDCKKMLIKQPEHTLGIWGLINADPTTGDVHETDIDSILILTRGSYFIADYDDQVDKITKYQEVLLQDISSLECGMGDMGKSLFGSSKSKPCLRINYKVNNIGGYYHMFRSACFGFFNNMPMCIKSTEDEMEYLKSICESFLISFDVCQLPQVPCTQGQILDKRKSKVINEPLSGNMYLDVVGIPQMTRNVSESQLLVLKNVGSKALSNMSNQFSKLNRIGSKLKRGKSRPANFVVGQNKLEVSSDSEEEGDSSIFQPDARDPNYGGNTSSSGEIEQGEEADEGSYLSGSKPDSFLPGVGIVMASNCDGDGKNALDSKSHLLKHQDSNLDNIQLTSIMQNVNITKPDIQINSGNALFDSELTSTMDKKMSHSYSEVDESINNSNPSSARLDKRSCSDYEVTLNISQSQSESALKNKLTNLTSPVASVTRDLVFSPFSKLAKGVQNIGSNIDRKFSGQVRNVSEKELEEHRMLQEKWHNCKTKLIAL
ncbi:phosphatidylinositide phosphatase SAC2 isoform X2 [Coccinella septempunctata]|uniref:phosphatidylinositide phosphatase SAC2 isoform X2 n=1 Tax=Coccinella septempunctata TaxID=41139 RepID=UPI001D0724EA|nr:phosphatidylinositide phosphatase SAC2 isoform X2 [Coccinella septempunctata]